MLSEAWQGLAGACGAASRHVLLLLVRAYRFWLKPWLGNTCRFEPSCSAYALQALQQHGAARGVALAGWRLLRCQPWCDGGCDAVPEVWTSAWGKMSATNNHASCGLFTALAAHEPPSTPVDDVPANRKRT